MPIQKIQLSHDDNWVEQDIRSLQVSYSSSAYYEYYPQLKGILESSPKFLFDLHLQLHKVIMSMIGLSKEH